MSKYAKSKNQTHIRTHMHLTCTNNVHLCTKIINATHADHAERTRTYITHVHVCTQEVDLTHAYHAYRHANTHKHTHIHAHTKCSCTHVAKST